MCTTLTLCMIFNCIDFRKALRSLQKISGIYGLVAPSAAVQFPGQIVGHLSGGECLRTLFPRETKRAKPRRRATGSSVNADVNEEGVTSGSGYSLQLTYDVFEGKYNGVLHVRVCWHEVVYLAQVEFAKRTFIY